MSELLERLYESLQRRLRPEDVAELVLSELKHALTRHEERVLKRAASRSLRRLYYQFTSMAQDFQRPVAPRRQAYKAEELFETAYPLSDVDCADVDKVAELICHVSTEIHKKPWESDFKADRLDRGGRKKLGLDISSRRYNKLFRFLCRFERKIDTYKLELRKYAAVRVAKSGLATRLPRADFLASLDAACFVAYFAARSGRRSVFTNTSQDRPFDEVCKVLLDRFKANPCLAGWRAIACVMPDAEVVKHLSDTDKIRLLADWMDVLHDVSQLLKQTWERGQFDRATMIVVRGDDSSTWNSCAGAWNAARQGWLSLMLALGMEDSVDELCFGKVMRLMAADVAAWHRASGGQLEPDTLVWAELPPPWEVFSGDATCTREAVERVCEKHGVDPIEKGWIQPRQAREAVPFQPTPELVHGVAVSHPHLATALRKAGWFSGKPGRELPEGAGPVVVYRDDTGAALGAAPADGDVGPRAAENN